MRSEILRHAKGERTHAFYNTALAFGSGGRVIVSVPVFRCTCCCRLLPTQPSLSLSLVRLILGKAVLAFVCVCRCLSANLILPLSPSHVHIDKRCMHALVFASSRTSVHTGYMGKEKETFRGARKTHLVLSFAAYSSLLQWNSCD